MDSPASVDWKADRYVPFIESIVFIDEDFTGASFAMQVRDRRDGGARRADLSTVTSAAAEGVRLIYAGTDTLANHVTAERLSQEDADSLPYASTDNVLLSELGLRINETTMEAMPFATEIGDDKKLFYDIQITPSGGVKEVYARGVFTVRAGVTQ